MLFFFFCFVVFQMSVPIPSKFVRVSFVNTSPGARSVRWYVYLNPENLKLQVSTTMSTLARLDASTQTNVRTGQSFDLTFEGSEQTLKNLVLFLPLGPKEAQNIVQFNTSYQLYQKDTQEYWIIDSNNQVGVSKQEYNLVQFSSAQAVPLCRFDTCVNFTPLYSEEACKCCHKSTPTPTSTNAKDIAIGVIIGVVSLCFFILMSSILCACNDAND